MGAAHLIDERKTQLKRQADAVSQNQAATGPVQTNAGFLRQPAEMVISAAQAASKVESASGYLEKANKIPKSLPKWGKNIAEFTKGSPLEKMGRSASGGAGRIGKMVGKVPGLKKAAKWADKAGPVLSGIGVAGEVAQGYNTASARTEGGKAITGAARGGAHWLMDKTGFSTLSDGIGKIAPGWEPSKMVDAGCDVLGVVGEQAWTSSLGGLNTLEHKLGETPGVAAVHKVGKEFADQTPAGTFSEHVGEGVNSAKQAITSTKAGARVFGNLEHFKKQGGISGAVADVGRTGRQVGSAVKGSSAVRNLWDFGGELSRTMRQARS